MTDYLDSAVELSDDSVLEVLDSALLDDEDFLLDEVFVASM